MPGFRCFTQPTTVAEPTIKERIVAMSPAIKQLVLKAYTNGKEYQKVAIETGISEDLLKVVYEQIDLIQQRTDENLLGETPASTQAELLTAIKDEFAEYFTDTIINSILTAKFTWCKYDGSGTFTFYVNNIKMI